MVPQTPPVGRLCPPAAPYSALPRPRPSALLSPEAFVAAAAHISERSPLAAETINRWRAHRLTTDARTAFAAQASALRWPDADFSSIPLAPSLLRVRRAADSGDDLWSVFNVLQKT